MNREPNEHVYKATTFQGKVSTDDFEHEVTFVAHAGSDGRLKIDPLEVPSAEAIALAKCMGHPGQHSRTVSLRGESADVKKFNSTNMVVSGISSKSEGNEIRLNTGIAEITIPRTEVSSDNAVAVKFSLRGFKSFRPNPVDAKCGRVHVQGQDKIQSTDEISGAITVVCSETDPDNNWYDDAIALSEFVWKGLQFGHGSRLQVPFVQVSRPDEVIATFYNGSARPAHLPAIHFLDQSEFIAALVSRFESDDDFPEGVWQAVGWLNNDSSINEVRFLTLMTAIETILENLVPDAASTLIPKPKFKEVRTALVKALDNFGLSDEEYEVLKKNVFGINRAPFFKKLMAVTEKYNLPSDVFNRELLKRLNKQRVSIVHTGRSLESEDLWECILFAWEIVARIVFAELRYKGHYESYAGGYEQKTLS